MWPWASSSTSARRRISAVVALRLSDLRWFLAATPPVPRLMLDSARDRLSPLTLSVATKGRDWHWLCCRSSSSGIGRCWRCGSAAVTEGAVRFRVTRQSYRRSRQTLLVAAPTMRDARCDPRSVSRFALGLSDGCVTPAPGPAPGLDRGGDDGPARSSLSGCDRSDEIVHVDQQTVRLSEIS
jgi:hypothetical protein